MTQESKRYKPLCIRITKTTETPPPILCEKLQLGILAEEPRGHIQQLPPDILRNELWQALGPIGRAQLAATSRWAKAYFWVRPRPHISRDVASLRRLGADFDFASILRHRANLNHVLTGACMGNHLDLVRWIIEDRKLYILADSAPDLTTTDEQPLQWAEQPLQWAVEQPLQQPVAAEPDAQLKPIQCLLDYDLRFAAANGATAVCAYLIERGATAITDAILAAAAFNKRETLTLLMRTSPRALAAAWPELAISTTEAGLLAWLAAKKIELLGLAENFPDPADSPLLQNDQ